MYWTPFVLVSAVMVALDVRTMLFGSVLAAFAGYESSMTFYHQFLVRSAVSAVITM